MINYVENPNLPNSKVKIAVMNCEDEVIVNYTKSFIEEIISTDNNFTVDERIANHADINVHHLGNSSFLIDFTQKDLFAKLMKLNADLTITGCDSSVRLYPYDCSLNFARFGRTIIGKESAVSCELNQYIRKNNLRLINVRQGYCKCSTLIIDESSLITDDISIYNAATKNGFDCLYVRKGNVMLNGFEYGFIGGCGGKIDKNKLLFFGDITMHCDFQKIDRFIKSKSCAYDYIMDYPLTDIGGIIPVAEF